jgi:hypothetical protein
MSALIGAETDFKTIAAMHSQCLSWVKNGNADFPWPCPVYRRKQTSRGQVGMSVSCQKWPIRTPAWVRSGRLSWLRCYDRRGMTRREGWPRPRSKLFSVMRSRFVLPEACEHPLVLGRVVKRGAQPGAGTSLAGLNNSRCCSRNGCYGISERLFIISCNLCESSF